MPTRLVREGWLTSERIDALSAAEECFFLRLILRVDDYGRFEANPRLLKSLLYPLRDRIRDTDISSYLAACERTRLIRCYETSGKRYLEISDFKQQRRSASKYPNPPPKDASTDACLADAKQMLSTCAADAKHPLTNENNCSPYSYSYSDAYSKAQAHAEDCSELAPQTSEPPEPPFLVFPCNGTKGKEWPLHASKVSEWKDAFPGIDVESECRKALQWLNDNPSKRKTFSGMTTFLNRWLSRSQDRGGGTTASLFGGGDSKPFGHAGRYRQGGPDSHEAKLREQGLIGD